MSKSITAKVQEAIAANRAKKPSKLKATVVVEPVQPTAQSQADEFADDVGGLFKKYKIEMPSVTRVVLSFVACVVFGGALGYVGDLLLNALVVGTLLLTGSALLALMIYVLGVMLMIAASWHGAGYISSFIVTKEIDACYQKCSDKVGNAKDSVLGYFKSCYRQVAS